MPQLRRALIWRRLDQPGAEYCALWRDGEGWQLRGTVVAAMDALPVQARYGVVCDGRWHTRAVHVALRAGGPEQPLHLRVDDQQRWWMADREVAPLQGCVDADLGVTPATNTLPIRRLNLAVGESRDVVAAWIRFPDLQIEPLAQTYTRLNETRYRYQSSGGYVTEIEVDDLGLVTSYGGVWERGAVLTAV